jgi:voltage-gated sodium channel
MPDSPRPGWAAAADRFATSRLFRRTILGVIAFAAVLVGVETYGGLIDDIRGPLDILNQVIIGIFVVELLVRLAAYGHHPWRFFLDPWNVFDFVIVALCLLPMDSDYAAVARIARVLRVLRLVSAVPRLQIIVSALFKALPSIFYVVLLLGLMFYVYAVIGTGLFGTNDPWHFGNLHLSLLSLFRVITLEDWTDVMYIQIYGSEAYAGYPGSTAGSRPMPIIGVVFFVSFVMFGTMIALNFFVGVVLNSLDGAQREQAESLIEATREDLGPDCRDAELAAITREVSRLHERLQAIVAAGGGDPGSGAGPRTERGAPSPPANEAE